MAFSLLMGGALSYVTVADGPGLVVSVSGLFGRTVSAAGFEALAAFADLSDETFDMANDLKLPSVFPFSYWRLPGIPMVTIVVVGEISRYWITRPCCL